MANNTEWVWASDVCPRLIEVSDHTDASGQRNDWPALIFGNVVVQGSLQSLQNFADRISREITLAVEALAEAADREARDPSEDDESSDLFDNCVRCGDVLLDEQRTASLCPRCHNGE